MNRKIKNFINFIAPVSITPFFAISCSTKIEYEYIMRDFEVDQLKLFDWQKPEDLKSRELYLGDYDNKWLNFSITGHYINELTIIDSVEKLNYFFTNHYYSIRHKKYKYWDNHFRSTEEIDKIKSKYNEQFFQTKIVAVNAGWSNSTQIKMPILKKDSKKWKKEEFYQNLISQNSKNKLWVNDHYPSHQSASFFEIVKSDYFE